MKDTSIHLKPGLINLLFAEQFVSCQEVNMNFMEDFRDLLSMIMRSKSITDQSVNCINKTASHFCSRLTKSFQKDSQGALQLQIPLPRPHQSKILVSLKYGLSITSTQQMNEHPFILQSEVFFSDLLVQRIPVLPS